MEQFTQLHSHEPMHRSNRSRWWRAALIGSLFLVGVSTYAWYSIRSSCDVDDVKETSTFLTSQLNFYDRLYQVAVTASRTAPDHPVNTMKQVLMDTQQVEVPACMRTARQELLDYMGTVILAFDEYRAGKEDAVVMNLIQQSDIQYADFRAELRTVNECAPYCLPYLK